MLSRSKHLLNLFSITAFDACTVNGDTIANSGDNTFTYTSASDFTGEDSFTYTLDDGANNTAMDTVLVTITPDPTDPADPAAPPATGGGGLLNPWSLILLPLLTYLRRKTISLYFSFHQPALAGWFIDA